MERNWTLDDSGDGLFVEQFRAADRHTNKHDDAFVPGESDELHQ